MTHYQTLGVSNQANTQEIDSAYRGLLATTQDKKDLLEAAYITLSNPFRRDHYDKGLAIKEDAAGIDRSSPYTKKAYQLLQTPHTLNHYEFVNRLFNIAQSDKEYLTPGKPLSKEDKNRIYWQFQPVLETVSEQKKELEQKANKTTKEKKKLDLLLEHESKIIEVTAVLTTGANEKCLYDLSLGPRVVSFTAEMKSISKLIGGWEKMAEFVKRHPDLSSANALFYMIKASCLNPDTLSLFMTCKDSMEFTAISDVVRCLSLANLLTPDNFEQAINHKKYARHLSPGLLSLGFASLLNQQTFEELISTGKQANQVASVLRLLDENNLLNPANQKRIITLAQKNKSIKELFDKGSEFLLAAKMTPEDKLAFQWKGETPELQALSLSIDEMFAYGLNLLADNEEDKAQVVFLLALELKKSLQNHFNQSVTEQSRTEKEFKEKFLELLHTQDESMAEHREEWKVVVANVAVSCTVIGFFILGGYYLFQGHCFWATTKRENLRDDIASSSWLQPVC